MLKFICLIALFAVATAQNWGWPEHIAPPGPLPINPPVWNEPQIPVFPQPRPPVWGPPMPERQGIRDFRCPESNGSFVTLFSHDNNCSQFYMCNNGLRCKKILSICN